MINIDTHLNSISLRCISSCITPYINNTVIDINWPYSWIPSNEASLAFSLLSVLTPFWNKNLIHALSDNCLVIIEGSIMQNNFRHRFQKKLGVFWFEKWPLRKCVICNFSYVHEIRFAGLVHFRAAFNTYWNRVRVVPYFNQFFFIFSQFSILH